MIDVAIIGAGPVGLFTVFKCGMVGLKTRVFDALPFVGGQCSALYPTKPIYDIPGYYSITGASLIESLFKQASRFDPMLNLNEKVIKLTKSDNSFIIQTDKGATFFAKSIIVAAGCGAFGPNKPPLEGLFEFEGTSVFYSISDPDFFKDKNVVIAGGGDSAVDWAIELSKLTKTLTLIHRRDKFKAAEYSLLKLKDLIHDGKIQLLFPYQLKNIYGENGFIEKLDLISLTGEILTLTPDILLPFFGIKSDIKPIQDSGLTIDKYHVVVDHSTCATNIDGIFAVGDIATYNKKKKLILCGFSEAAHAAYAVKEYLYPGQIFHFEHSTNMHFSTA